VIVPTTEPLMAATNLRRRYEGGRSGERTDAGIDAVRDVSLILGHRESLAIVGRSGSGKSSLARLLLAIERPDHGEVRFEGQIISSLPERRIRPLRRHFQAVFQDPGSSLDPCLSVASIIAEPLAAHRIGTPGDRRHRVREVLDRVGLRKGAEHAFPDAFSGGERQRIAIARALAPDPKLLVLDEPTSSLDASVRSEILNLLLDLRRDLGLAMIMISHDLAVVRELCERVAVMHEGSLVEIGMIEDVLARPAHSATQALLDASLSLIR
jgi:ABC-type glutathione transport system ATPase component